MGNRSYITKTVVYSDLYDGISQSVETYLSGINKRWLIEGVVHMISVDRFDSFSMDAERGLLVIFQDFTDKSEVKRLFHRLKEQEKNYPGVWLTLINHQALYRLLRKILTLRNEQNGRDECFEAYEGLLKAILVENGDELEREKEILGKTEGDAALRDAMIIMQQDILNLDKFGENKKELEKVQIMKYLALCEFGKHNKQVGDAIKRVINKHGLESVYKYMLLAQMPLGVYQEEDGFKEGLICVKKSDFEKTSSPNLWNEFVSYVSDKCIDVWDTERLAKLFSAEEIIDNTCFRKRPVLKMSDDEYLIASQTYYSHLLYDGFWWSVKNELKIELSDNAVYNLLTKDFSEKVLFCGLVKLMLGDRRICMYDENCFNAHQAAPDFAIKPRHHLYMFEYKDMRVQRDVAEGNDMNLLMDFIDDRLNKDRGVAGKNKGIPQLVRNMEDYFLGAQPWGLDYRKGNVKIHPVLVVNSRLFGVRGINFILQKKMQQRIQESEILRQHNGLIGDFHIIDYDILVLVVAQAYKNFGYFQNIMNSYQGHLNSSSNMMIRCDSFRHFVMNKWEREMTAKDMRRFKLGMKRVVNSIMRIGNGFVQ